MSAADDAQLIAQLRLTAPHSDDGYLLLRAANAVEDANARVALAHADALNAAAAALWNPEGPSMLGVYATATGCGHDGHDNAAVEVDGAYADWLIHRAKAIEVGEI